VIEISVLFLFYAEHLHLQK